MFLSVCAAGETFAAKGLVIKLDVTDFAQDLINKNIRVRAGMGEKSARHHVTVGYIDENLPDGQMKSLGEEITTQLEKIFSISNPNNHIRFDVKEAAQPFGNGIALIPVNEVDLKTVNNEVNNMVKSFNHQLNNTTQPHNYIPHMSFSLN